MSILIKANNTWVPSTPYYKASGVWRKPTKVFVKDADVWKQVYPDWAPIELFSNGENGAVYDPSDLATLFQDVAGTIPVTSDGDPVALMLDKSGNDNHAIQTISASRPIYKTDGTLHWIYFNGVDAFFKHTCSLTGSQTLAAAAEGGSTELSSFLFECTSPGTKRRATLLARVYGSSAWGAFTGSWFSSGKSLSATSVIVNVGDTITQSLYTNGIFNKEAESGSSVPRDNRYIGCLYGTSAFFEGSLYGCVAVGDALDDVSRNYLESYLASKASISL